MIFDNIWKPLSNEDMKYMVDTIQKALKYWVMISMPKKSNAM